MKLPPIIKLNNAALLKAATGFAHKGKLAKSKNNLIYLNIDDDYIYLLFPLLKDKQISMPDYFNNKGSVGAHITVSYPEEGKEIRKEDLGKTHIFSIKELIAAEIGPKTYYALLVESPTLLQLRKKYHLPDLLCFKGYSIGFHITVGIKVG